MGRSSSTGYLFLVRRNDAGQFTYHRDVSEPVARLVVGEVLLSWSGRKRRFTGTRVIKLSLGTGDEKTARQRWGEVHPQIEALIRKAEARTRRIRNDSADTDAHVHLDRAQVHEIASQAYHDVLATDDRAQIESSYMSPMGAIVLDLNRKHGGRQDTDVRIAEQAARRVEQKILQGRLRRRETHMLDRPIPCMELGGDSGVTLWASAKVGDRLSPEQIDALASGTRLDDIASEVEQRLQENGLDLPAGHSDRRHLALAITRAKMRAFNDVQRRDSGAPIETPIRPSIRRSAEAQQETSAPTLHVMQERWIRMVRPGDKQIGDSTRYLRLFVSMHGDLAVDEIAGQHIRAFRDALLDCPRNAPKHLASAGITDLVAWAEANPNTPTLGRGTINHKALGTLSTLLDQAVADEHIASNPAKGKQLTTKSSDKQARRPYTVDELHRLLATAIYQPVPKIPKAGKGFAAYWLPLLSLFTGARLEELGQALVCDVKRSHGIDYLEVTTLTDDDSEVMTSSKSLKSDAARRRLPLHATLIQLGFLNYLAAVRSSGATRLFPELDEYRGRYTKNWSRWWGRWLTSLGLHDPALTFHSFRHTFTAELRRLKCDISVMKELLGHAQSDVTSGYGRIDGWLHELGDLNRALQGATFKTLDVSHLKELRPWRPSN